MNGAWEGVAGVKESIEVGLDVGALDGWMADWGYWKSLREHKD